MLRKLGYAALAFTLMLAAGAGVLHDIHAFTAFERINTYVLRQMDTVDRLGEHSPLQARAVANLARLPNELFSFIAPAQAQQQPGMTIDRGIFRNHAAFACGTRPTVANATITSGSCDFRGQFTAPTNSVVTVTFGTAYQSAPICTVTRSDAQSATPPFTVSTTALSFVGMSTGAGLTYNWLCLGVML